MPCPTTVEGPSPLEIEITMPGVITVLLRSLEHGGMEVATLLISMVSIMQAVLHHMPLEWYGTISVTPTIILCEYLK